MFLDHFNAFANHQPVEMATDLPSCLFEVKSPSALRPRSGGLLPHTQIETETGFCQARELKAGDMVFTFDGGCQEVVTVKHSVPRLTSMMHVPAGALGNDRAMDLPTDQIVALDEATAEACLMFRLFWPNWCRWPVSTASPPLCQSVWPVFTSPLPKKS